RERALETVGLSWSGGAGRRSTARPAVDRPQMTAVGTLQVQKPRLVIQQVLPVRIAIATALAISAPDGVLALWAVEPGAATPIGGGINRQHGRPPDPGAPRRPPGRRRYVADRRQDWSTASRTRDPPGRAPPPDPSRPRSPRRWRLGGAPHRGSGRMRTPDDQPQQPRVLSCRHVERATRVSGSARGRQWPPSHSEVEVDHSFSTGQVSTSAFGRL